MNSLNVTAIPSHFGEAQVAKLGPQDRRIGHSPIEYRLTYINNLPVDVTIEWRSGFKFVLPSEPSMNNTSLIMRVEIIIQRSVKVDIQRLLSVVDENSSPEMRAMREAFSLQIQENTYGGAKLILDYPISLESLQTYGGTVYYHELDCVVSLLSFQDCPAHPYSAQGAEDQIVAGSPINHGGVGFGYAVEIVDNSMKYGERYLNIGSKIYKVVPKKDPNRRDGIYIISNYAVDGELGAEGVSVKHYPFKDSETTLGLYRTYEDALHYGDPTLARKREITTLEHQLAMNRTELQNTRQEHERETLERNIKLQKLEEERDNLRLAREKVEHEMKLERERVKDFYEDRSYHRKDSSDTVKFLPSIIVGIGAIFMAIRSFIK